MTRIGRRPRPRTTWRRPRSARWSKTGYRAAGGLGRREDRGRGAPARSHAGGGGVRGRGRGKRETLGPRVASLPALIRVPPLPPGACEDIRRPADHHGPGDRQRRPGARGVLALCDQRRRPAEPGRSGHGATSTSRPRSPNLRQGQGGVLRPEGRRELHSDSEDGVLYRWQDGSMEANGERARGVARRAPARHRTAALRQRHATRSDRQAVHLRSRCGAPGGQQLPLGSRLQERGDRPAARRGTRRRTACSCRGSEERGDDAAAGRCPPSPRPARRRAGSWCRAPRAARQSQQCVFQIDNVDRQGSVKETTAGHQLLRRRQRSAELPGHHSSPCRATAWPRTAATWSSSSAT